MEENKIIVRSFDNKHIFNGKRYAKLSAFMEGTLQRTDGSKGKYSVPIELLYPSNATSNSFKDDFFS